MQPLRFVITKLYVPDDKLEIFGTVSPVDHKYLNGGKGSVIIVLAVPVLPPKQLLLLVLTPT